MLNPKKISFVVILLFCVINTWADNLPEIGYIYPAGGQQGTTIQIIAGGQNLRRPNQVYVSGKGVEVSVIQYMRPIRNLQREQRDELQRRIREVWNKRLDELPAELREKLREQEPKQNPSSNPQSESKEEVKLPDHPLWHDLENKSLRELLHIRTVLQESRAKEQPNRQISEIVLLEVKIAPDAAPGFRELRIETAQGLTNPIVFQVGTLPEVRELEPNDQQAYQTPPRLADLPKPQVPDAPLVLNGQIMPGDVDRFRFRARQGQELVIESQARSLIPYLADAVPGWFQAVMTLYDRDGKEVAFADDYRFNPDPVLFYKIARSGEYELEIRDSIYRGRQDFVYRISVGEQPFITQMFPLGGRQGNETTAAVEGRHLPQTQLTLDTQNTPGIYPTAFSDEKTATNAVLYHVDTLPECNEVESNDSVKDAQKIQPGIIINGRIEKTGDADIYRFSGKAGETIVAEVFARRLNSPLDSLVQLLDSAGKVIQLNDDYFVKDQTHLHKDLTGLVTHHADSYLSAKLPQNGTYYIRLTDTQNHGGGAYGYRLRISPPRPDFALRVTPSSLSFQPGSTQPVCVHILRNDGYDGPVEVVVKDAPPGFSIDGGVIPAGLDRICMTLTAPPKSPGKPIDLKLEGRAWIGGQVVSRPAVPADDVMQAFLYRHLVPAQQMLVTVRNARWPVPPVRLAGPSPLRMEAGGTARVQLNTRSRPGLEQVRLELHEAPKGIRLENVEAVPEGLAFQLKMEPKAIQADIMDNLIIEAYRQEDILKDDKPTGQTRRISMGYIPAIPIQVIPAKNNTEPLTAKAEATVP